MKKNSSNQPIKHVTSYGEVMTAGEFLRVYNSDRDSIESATPMPSPLGSRDLGKILVHRSRPVFKKLSRSFT